MIKIKDAGNGLRTIISCDKNGVEQSRTPSFGKNSSRWAESEEWLNIPGNELLPLFTEEELEAKEQKAKSDALTSQRSTLRTLLDDSDKKLIADSPYSADDQNKWMASRQKWREQMLLNEIVEIEPKPF